MKKFYSLITLFVLAFGLTASAQTVTFDFEANTWNLPLGSGSGATADAGNITEPIVEDGVTIDFQKGTSNTNPRMWTGPQARIYNGNTVTITPSDENKAVKSITFTTASTNTNPYFGLTTTVGELKEFVWSGNATSVTFTATTQNRFKQIVVELGDKDNATVTPGVNVPAPTISPFNTTTFNDSVKVTITAAEGTTAYYTIDGTDPTNASTAYTEPFKLTESATVKAIAYDADNNASAIKSVTYTIEKSSTDPEEGTETVTKYLFQKATAVESGKKYLLVAATAKKAATAISGSKNYGYLPTIDVETDGDKISTTDSTAAFTFTAVNNGFTIQQADGKLLYMANNYNSFNLAEAVDSNNVWTVEIGADGAFITNVAKNKFIQYTTYSTFGAYAEAQNGAELPVLYVEAGSEEVEDTTTVDEAIYTNDMTTQGDLLIEQGELPEGLSYVWNFGAQYGAKASSYVGGQNYEVESYLVTPTIDLTNIKEATLSFDQCINKFFTNVNEEATLWVREVSASTRAKAVSEWTQITISYPEITTGNWSAFETQNVDLGAYDGKQIQIGFKYVGNSAGAGTWEIKNVKVDGQTASAIQSVATKAQTNAIFDLQGRRVEKAVKGIYIIGGKKVIVK